MQVRSALFTFVVPLPIKAHQLAENICRQVISNQTPKQIYLNTLAVYAVDFYLKCMGIKTDLENSDRYNQSNLIFTHIADLAIKDIGTVECIPVLPNTNSIQISLEAWSDRIGYVAVRISESLRSATILGFVPKATQESIPIEQLQSLEEFLEYLETLSQENVLANQSVPLTETVEDVLQRIFNTLGSGWQTVESVLGIESPPLVEAWRARHLPATTISTAERGFMRARLIKVDPDISDKPIALIVAMLPSDESGEIDVAVEISPAPDYNSLPSDLELMLLDKSGTMVLYAQPKANDPTIQFEFSIHVGETFTIKLNLGDTSYIKEFPV